MNQEKTGKFIAGARNQQGLTQKELAEKIGVSDKTISKWECGKSMPDISYMDALCNSLDINMNELISGERLTEAAYSVKAEENIMALMKENEKTRKSTKRRIIIGILLVVLAIVFILICTGGIKLLYSYFDMPTIIMLLLLNVACVMLSGKREYADILKVLQKISIHNGVLIGCMSLIIVLYKMGDYSQIGPNLVICLLAIVYAVIEYLVVFLLRQHVNETKSE